MEPVSISFVPNHPIDNAEIHHLEYIDREHRFTVCIGEFKRLQNISEVKPGDKVLFITERTMNKTPVLWELEKISHNSYLKVKGYPGFHAWWNCFRMINP